MRILEKFATSPEFLNEVYQKTFEMCKTDEKKPEIPFVKGISY